MEDFGNWTVEDARKGRCQLEDVGDPRELEIPPEPIANDPFEGLLVPADETPAQRDVRHKLELAGIVPELVDRAIGELRSGKLSTAAALTLATKASAARAAQAKAQAEESGSTRWTPEQRSAVLTAAFPFIDFTKRFSGAWRDEGRPPAAITDVEPRALPDAPAAAWKAPDSFTDAAAARAGAELAEKVKRLQ